MRRIVIIGGALAGGAAILVVAGLFWFFGGDTPADASVSAALAQAGVPAPNSAPSASPIAVAPGAAVASTGSASTDLAGTYQVVKGGGTFAGYRIKEELRSIGSNTAVGRSPDVAGSLTFDGKAITAVEVTVSLASLKSDSSRRDSFMQRNALQILQFPTATFMLSEPIAIPSLLAEGEKAQFEAIGELTLHGVTQRVTVTLEGTRQAGAVVVAGSSEILLTDYKIQKPVSPYVSVEDKGLMEFQLTFRK